MARPSNFTPEEDSIIAATSGLEADEVNAQLRKAGFSLRTSQQIRNRRLYLKKVGTNVEEGLAGLVKRRDWLVRRLEELPRQQADLEAELTQVTKAIKKEVGSL